MKVGYARISSNSGSLTSQIERLTLEGCERIFQEVRSGSKMETRMTLNETLSFVRTGDVLVVTSVCRLARNLTDLLKILEILERKNVGLLSIQQPQLELGTPTGKMLLSCLGMVYEMERSFIVERSRIGVQRAKALGKVFGRPRKRNDSLASEMKEMFAQGVSAKDLARDHKVSLATTYRMLRE